MLENRCYTKQAGAEEICCFWPQFEIFGCVAKIQNLALFGVCLGRKTKYSGEKMKRRKGIKPGYALQRG